MVASAAVTLLSDILQPALLGLLSLWLLAGGLWAFLTHLSINNLRLRGVCSFCLILTNSFEQEGVGVPVLSLHAPGHSSPGDKSFQRSRLTRRFS